MLLASAAASGFGGVAFLFSPGNLFNGRTVVLQLAMMLLSIAISFVFASQPAKRPMNFAGLFRPMALAQAPQCLQVLPVVGEFAGLWCIVTNTLAIRDASGCTAGRAMVLSALAVCVSSVGFSFLRTWLFG